MALANTGYEAGSADCSLPQAVAARLGLWPSPPGSHLHTVRGYGGVLQVHKLADAVRVRVIPSDRQGLEALAGVLITGTDDEVILSDTLLDALGIVPLVPGRGIWRFSDEPDSQRRPSSPRETW
ncbi:MAG: hypothetical protein HY720_21030 [Planctomycetes bacterium]|nr:hypothetical protein [Planctomycetota bacterium]